MREEDAGCELILEHEEATKPTLPELQKGGCDEQRGGGCRRAPIWSASNRDATHTMVGSRQELEQHGRGICAASTGRTRSAWRRDLGSRRGRRRGDFGSCAVVSSSLPSGFGFERRGAWGTKYLAGRDFLANFAHTATHPNLGHQFPIRWYISIFSIFAP